MKNWINKRNIVCILLTLCAMLSSLTVFADDYTSPVGYTLYQYSQGEEAIQEFEKQKPELLEAYKQDFPTESGWWDEYAIMPILTGVISGYPDGTIKPNNPVTGGEFAKMVATAFEGYIPSGGRLDNDKLEGKWYNNYYNAMAKAYPYPTSDALGDSRIIDRQVIVKYFTDEPIRRSEVAYVLAKIIDSDSLDAYIKKVKYGDLSSMAGYVDFSQHIFTGTKYIGYDGYSRNFREWLYSDVNQLREFHSLMPQNQAAAIMMLKDLGIMVGDGAGHISPLGNVTRAEIFKLINECCRATKDYKSLKFFGWEYAGYDFFTSEELKALPWVYTMETVINPEAEEKYQYTFGDLEWSDLSLAHNERRQNEVMTGRHNITSHFTETSQQKIKTEFIKNVIDEVKNSVKVENGIIKFYIPPFLSKHHEIRVVYQVGSDTQTFNSTYNVGWNEVNFNTDKSSINELRIECVGKLSWYDEYKSIYYAFFDYVNNTQWSGENLPDWIGTK